MAVLAGGKVVSQGTPVQLLAKLNGQVWKKTIDKRELEECKAKYKVISNQLKAGQMQIRVHSLESLADGFEQATANLEDVYFVTTRFVDSVLDEKVAEKIAETYAIGSTPSRTHTKDQRQQSRVAALPGIDPQQYSSMLLSLQVAQHRRSRGGS